ncbi:protein of unknown function [Shinella sp. WSC3-e]|nr:protein of unknown function [Shinella sp. WSC3-e]
MMDVVHADIAAYPTQGAGQVVVRGAVHGRVLERPLRRPRPIGVFELVLDEEQPDACRSGKEHDRQMDDEKRNRADRPDKKGGECCDGGIRCHRRNPWQGAGSHHAERQTLLEEKEPRGTDAEHDDRMPVKAVAEPPSTRQRSIFCDSERGDITDTPFVEIAGRGMMFSMGPAPVVVGCQCQHTDRPSRPIIQAAPAEEGAMAAVMLQHEQAQKEPGCRHNEDQAEPVTEVHRRPSAGPQENKGHKGYGQFERASANMGLAIGGEDFQPGFFMIGAAGSNCVYPGHRQLWRPFGFLPRAVASCSTMPLAMKLMSVAFFSAFGFVGLDEYCLGRAIGTPPYRLPLTTVFLLGEAIRPSRCAFLRASLRARLMASAFSRTRFCEVFS